MRVHVFVGVGAGAGAALCFTACGVDASGPVGEFEARPDAAGPAAPGLEADTGSPLPSPPPSSEADPAAPDSGVPTTAQGRLLAAVNTLGFTRVDSTGHAPGFNLDGLVSDSGDRETCWKLDFLSPEGEPGIDNQLATLVPLFEGIGIGALEGLVQNSIKEGGLLIMLQADDLDSDLDDPDVSLRMRFGQGSPLLGTDGLLLSGQTFHPSPEAEEITIDDARLEGGILSGGPFEAVLPVVVFGVKYVLPLHNAHLTAVPTYDGGLEQGILGGEVAIDDLMGIANQAAAFDGSILGGVTLVLNGRGDLGRDENGNRRRLSGAFTFTAASAYLA